MAGRKRSKRKTWPGSKVTHSGGKRTAKVRNRAHKNCQTHNPKPMLFLRGD